MGRWVLGWEELVVVHEEELICWYLVNLGAVLWEDGDFAVVEAHRMEVSRPNSFVVKSGAKLGCTLGGVHGDCDGDRIWSRSSRTGSELRGGRGATCLGEVSAAKRGALVALAAS